MRSISGVRTVRLYIHEACGPRHFAQALQLGTNFSETLDRCTLPLRRAPDGRLAQENTKQVPCVYPLPVLCFRDSCPKLPDNVLD